MEFILVESKKKNYAKLQESRVQESRVQESRVQESKGQESKGQESKGQESKGHDSKLQEKKESKILTQEEISDILISKIKSFDNVEIKTKEINKEKGLFYAINVRVDLSKIGYGVFYSAKLNTVSHINRIVNIKLVFSDNEILHHDMKINTDALIQCFREIAPDTITSIHIDTFKDQIENEHLSLIISTIKGSSLTYVYKSMMKFVSIINDKYGKLPLKTKNDIDNNNNIDIDINNIADELISKNNQDHTIEEKNYDNQQSNQQQSNQQQSNQQQSNQKNNINININNETKEQNTKQNDIQTINNKSIDNKTIINNSILNVIENLENEEKRLLRELENIRKLIKSQNSILEISQKDYKVNNPINIPTTTGTSASVSTSISTSASASEVISNSIINKSSFAYKVMHGDK
jgi:hypothetical protein